MKIYFKPDYQCFKHPIPLFFYSGNIALAEPNLPINCNKMGELDRLIKEVEELKKIKQREQAIIEANDLLFEDQICERLRISKQTLRNWLNATKVPFKKVGVGTSIMYSYTDIIKVAEMRLIAKPGFLKDAA